MCVYFHCLKRIFKGFRKICIFCLSNYHKSKKKIISSKTQKPHLNDSNLFKKVLILYKDFWGIG